MGKVAQTAAEYFDRYKAAYDNEALAQGVWNSEREGKHIACALGVLGDDVDSSTQCPASVMPRWLAQMVPWFFDSQTKEDAFEWGLKFAEQLKRLDGKVPFTVVYDWQAKYVTQVGIEAAEKRDRDPSSHKAVQALHIRAAGGDLASRDEWYKALRRSYANANANANANAIAGAYAYAIAIAGAYANAYAYADAYANAYAIAGAYAYADAIAGAYAYADAYAKTKQKSVNRMAMGLVECMSRIQA